MLQLISNAVPLWNKAAVFEVRNLRTGTRTRTGWPERLNPELWHSLTLHNAISQRRPGELITLTYMWRSSREQRSFQATWQLLLRNNNTKTCRLVKQFVYRGGTRSSVPGESVTSFYFKVSSLKNLLIIFFLFRKTFLCLSTYFHEAAAAHFK